MITLLSPSKKLSSECTGFGVFHTKPTFLSRSKELVKILREFDPPGLESLMGISSKLSETNWERFQNWTSDYPSAGAREAVLLFKGDTYDGLDAESLPQSDMLYAQNSVRILSGLYGVLKPLDLMLPYRLEMGTKLKNDLGNHLYAFWGKDLAASISNELKTHSNATVINCASNEYFKSVNNDSLNANVITPVFKEVKNGKSRILSFYAKKARGMMARFIIENKIEKPDEILEFKHGGYKYSSSLSEVGKPVFTRPQP